MDILGDVRLFFLQSEHILLGSNFNSDLIVAWFFAARSAAGFGGRLDMVVCCERMDSKGFEYSGEIELSRRVWLVGFGRVLSRLAIDAYFGREVGIKGAGVADVCVPVCTDYR